MNFLVSFQFQLPSWPLNQPAGRVVEPKSYFTTYSMAKKGLIDQWFDNALFRETFGYSHLYITEEAVAMVAAAQKQSRPRQTHSHNKRPGTLTLVAGPVVISLCTMVLVMLCGGLSLSVACSTSWSLCSLCQFGFFVSSPATHVCGFVTQPAYRLWMPFQGGSLHVFLQGIGWSCFALLLMQWCASYYGEEMLLTEFPYVGDSRLKAAFGLIAQVTLGLSALKSRPFGLPHIS
ncbi:LCP2 [Symbiodinium sp. CCMP2456]|nr:LCP2 [Symbiodinium sp. CCMP2456]